MIKQIDHFTILQPLPVKLSFDELRVHLSATSKSDLIIDTAHQTYSDVNNIWTPRAIYRWLLISEVTPKDAVLHHHDSNTKIRLKTGYSSIFLQPAQMVMTGVYTIGNRLEKQAKAAAAEKNYLKSYILDQISLLVLEKTGAALNTMVEEKASEHGWKIGPLLSPGSVHGWNLADQFHFCSYFPLPEIEVNCSPEGVLSPLSTLSFLIGIGESYTNTHVGAPCEVCSNKAQCAMYRDNNDS